MLIHGMSTSEYLETPQGQIGRYHWRKRQYNYYTFDREPPGKATGNNEKADFQCQILNEMKRCSRRAYRSKIAAEICLNPTSQNPPHIHTTMKKLLDIFGKPLPESGIRRKGHIYQDDNQIAYLSVRYQLGSDEKKIHAKFAPFRHVLENMKLGHDILLGHYDNHINRSDFESEIDQIKDIHKNHDFTEAIDELRELEEKKDDVTKSLTKEAYESLHFINKMRAQEALLTISEISILDLYSILNTSGVFQEDIHLPGLAKIMSGWVTDLPIRIQLPALPTREDRKKPFQDKIRKCMREFKAKNDLLQPLYIPVIMQVAYRPPMASAGFYKDLDNIMRDFILPIFHAEFKPPPTHSSVFVSKEIEDDHPLREMIERLPRSVPYSVARYEIIEVPRHSEDKEDGLLLVGISPGSFASSSAWGKIDKVVDVFIESYRDL